MDQWSVDQQSLQASYTTLFDTDLSTCDMSMTQSLNNLDEEDNDKEARRLIGEVQRMLNHEHFKNPDEETKQQLANCIIQSMLKI